jgi:hypothetical protein
LVYIYIPLRAAIIFYIDTCVVKRLVSRGVDALGEVAGRLQRMSDSSSRYDEAWLKTSPPPYLYAAWFMIRHREDEWRFSRWRNRRGLGEVAVLFGPLFPIWATSASPLAAQAICTRKGLGSRNVMKTYSVHMMRPWHRSGGCAPACLCAYVCLASNSFLGIASADSEKVVCYHCYVFAD